MGIFSWLFGKKPAVAAAARVDDVRRARPTASGPAGNALMYLLDRSGSMRVAVDDMVIAINSSFNNNRKDPLASVTPCHVVSFDTLGFDKIRDGEKMLTVRPITRKEVEPRGATPLNDAIGYVIDPVLDAPQVGKQIVICFTDGLENDSKKYPTAESIAARIREFERRGNLFIFLAANLDAQKIGAQMGVAPERSLNTRANGQANTGKALLYAIGAATALGLAYAALKPGEAIASSLGFSDDDRKEAMGGFEDWQGEIQKDIDGLDLSAESVFNLPPEAAAQIQALPEDFDPAKGSLDNPESENAIAATSDDDAADDEDDAKDDNDQGTNGSATARDPEPEGITPSRNESSRDDNFGTASNTYSRPEPVYERSSSYESPRESVSVDSDNDSGGGWGGGSDSSSD